VETQKHILIIDDHEDTVTLLEDFLSENGFSISKAFTGQEGLNHIVERRPDLIILDMALPDMSGSDVCAQLRNNPATREIPIVVCTAHKVSLEEKMKGFRAGVDDYLIRPFELAELLARITAVLRRSQTRPKAELLADLQTILSSKSKAIPTPPTPPSAPPKTFSTASSSPLPKSENAQSDKKKSQPLGLFQRLWQVLNYPSSVFVKAKYSHDFFTALIFVLTTPMVASLVKVSDVAGGFDSWIGYFSLGIVTNLVMWFATAGLLHLTMPFHGVNLSMRRSLSVAGLAWAPRLVGALFAAAYGLLSIFGIAVQSSHFTTGIDMFFNVDASSWISVVGHVGIFDLWCAWITLTAVWAISKSDDKKWGPISILIGAICLIFGTLTHY
jgi:DNA-binding response OmpR family regulator